MCYNILFITRTGELVTAAETNTRRAAANSSLTADNASFQTRVTELLSNAEAQEVALKNLRTHVSKIEDEVVAERKKSASISAELEGAVASLSAHMSERALLCFQGDALRSSLGAERQKSAALAVELERATESLTLVGSELETEKEEHVKVFVKHNATRAVIHGNTLNLEKLEKVIVELKQENEGLAATVSELQGKLEVSEKYNESSNTTTSALELKLSILQAEIAVTEAIGTPTFEELNTLQDRYDEACEEMTLAQDAKLVVEATLQSALQAHEEALEVCEADKATAAAIALESDANLAAMNDSLLLAEQLGTELNALTTELKHENASLTRTVSVLTERVTTAAAERATLRTTNDELLASTTAMIATKEELESKTSMLTLHLDTLASDRTEFEARNIELDAELSEKTNALNAHLVKHEALVIQVAALHHNAESKESQLETLAESHDELRAEYEQKEAILSAHLAEHDALVDRTGLLSDNLEASELERMVLEETHADLHAEHGALEKRAAALSSSLEASEFERMVLEETHADLRAEMKQQSEKLSIFEGLALSADDKGAHTQKSTVARVAKQHTVETNVVVALGAAEFERNVLQPSLQFEAQSAVQSNDEMVRAEQLDTLAEGSTGLEVVQLHTTSIELLSSPSTSLVPSSPRPRTPLPSASSEEATVDESESPSGDVKPPPPSSTLSASSTPSDVEESRTAPSTEEAHLLTSVAQIATLRDELQPIALPVLLDVLFGESEAGGGGVDVERSVFMRALRETLKPASCVTRNTVAFLWHTIAHAAGVEDTAAIGQAAMVAALR